MPLRLDLKPGEKVFIGGAVVENGDARCHLSILNDVPILREKDILTEERADTPCKKIYLVIQLMYMDAANLPAYQQRYWEVVRPVLDAAPSTTPLISTISAHVAEGRYYQAMKAARELIAYEQELIEHAHPTP